ncbi:MAG TPA: M56 family metallopeptidase [Bryobacteraceae bacterium]|nr:M56 family metallopeptidase [Bryobacteraceae bacterium]
MWHLMLECAVRSVLIAAGTAAVLTLARVKTAGARHAAWTGVVLWMLVLPLWTAWVPKATLRMLPAQAAPAVSRTEPLGSLAPAPDAASARHLAKGHARRWPGSDWRSLVAITYFLGVAVLLMRLASGTIRANRLVRMARLREGRLTSAWCAAPLTVGWLRPKVILPECWRSWTRDQLDAVLSHEQEHARRRDPMVQWLALFNRAIFWFHPLAWVLERRLSALAEEACDTAVLAAGYDPFDYTRYLLEMAQSVARSGARIQVLGMGMPGSFLAKRIRRILDVRPHPRLARPRMICAAIACAAVSAVFAVSVVDRRAPVQTTPKGERAAWTPARVPESQAREAPPKPLPRPRTLLAQARSQPPEPLPDRRLVALCFDLSAMTEGDLTRAVDAARKMVQSRLQPQDRFAIMTYRGAEVRVAQDFTDDRDLLVRTIEHVTGADMSSADTRSAVLGTVIRTLAPLEARKALVMLTARPADGTDAEELKTAATRARVAVYVVNVHG